MKEAHEAIFSAEQSTIWGAASGKYSSEIQEVEAKVTSLKDKILQPSWKKNEMKTLIEDLKTAHAKLNGKIEEERKGEASRAMVAKVDDQKQKQEDKMKQAEEAERKKHGLGDTGSEDVSTKSIS